MKNRPFHGGGGGYSGEGSSKRDHMKNKRRNESRLGGKGLSLEAFANAKSRIDGYNPSLIKKQREFYRNAKYVSKFKKRIKQESWSKATLPTALQVEDVDESENEAKQLQKMTRENQSEVQLPTPGFEDVEEDENETKPSMPNTKKKKKKKKNVSLQSIREDFEERHEEQVKAKLEREAAIKAKREERAKVEAARKAQRNRMSKKTLSGQPVMKYRIEHLLDLVKSQV